MIFFWNRLNRWWSGIRGLFFSEKIHEMFDLWFSFTFFPPTLCAPSLTAAIEEWSALKSNHSNDKEENKSKPHYYYKQKNGLFDSCLWLRCILLGGLRSKFFCFDIGHMFDMCVYLIACKPSQHPLFRINTFSVATR